MSVYDIRMKRLALMLLPTSWRRPLIASLVQSAVQGPNLCYSDFVQWRTDKNYRLWHNGQVCYLRAALNDTFDPTARRISVDDQETAAGGTIVYLRVDERARNLKTGRRGSSPVVVINRRGFGGVSGYDFWVSVPLAVGSTIDEVRLKAVVNTYKLAAKRWTINYY